MSNALRIGNRSISYEQAKEMLFPELIPQKGKITYNKLRKNKRTRFAVSARMK